MIRHTRIFSSHLIVVTTVRCTGTFILLSFRKTLSGLCLFSVATATTSSLKEDFQASLIYCCRLIVLGDNYIFPNQVNVKINVTFASVCDFWGLACSPSTPVRLTLLKFCATKILYRVYLFSSIFAMYIFGQVVVITKHSNKR